MTRIETIFRDARQQGRRLIMPFVCAGHTKPDTLVHFLPALQHAGAGVVEIGLPFSDPIADGPVIAAAMHDALERGTTPEQVFNQVAQVRASLDIGLVAMVSVSIVYRAGGPDGFAAQAAQAGFDGVIYPDAPFEEADDLLAAAREAGMTASLLISPTTPAARAEAIAKACSGFVYLLARTGITGERSDAPDVAGRVAALRKATDTPIACGFGISTPEHVRAVVQHADAAIVGSALVKRMSQAEADGQDAVEAAVAFVRELVQAAAEVSKPEPDTGNEPVTESD
ncbi:MAG: tryptophan synthase subunit alpha [Planctomycetota bacterium]|nr:tryptophan synthase subunit alpha [Planctomycetota bacterium]